MEKIYQPLTAQCLIRGKKRTKLSHADAISIYKAKSTSVQANALGVTYGVCEKTIRDVWSGRTWAKETWHLEPARKTALKQIGRPKGSKDSKPRKRRVLPHPISKIDAGESYFRYSKKSKVANCQFQDPFASTCIHEHQKTSATSLCCEMTLDDQIYLWESK